MGKRYKGNRRDGERKGKEMEGIDEMEKGRGGRGERKDAGKGKEMRWKKERQNLGSEGNEK